MRTYRCRACGAPLFFENSVCVSCGSALGYSRAEHDIVPVDAAGRYVDASGLVWHVCRNLNLSGCTWLAPIEGDQCFSCSLTRVRPNDADLAGLGNFAVAERSKRQLITELDRLALPIRGKHEDPVDGLCFDLLSSAQGPVITGHVDGVITIDLSEGDVAYREQVRGMLDEPYRTMLGHFRHEVGHYFQWQLVRDAAVVERCRELFGDEREDYQAALARHYAAGPATDWRASFISHYAAMHPFEDFAETWAHCLHIRETLDTAAAFDLLPLPRPADPAPFRDVVSEVWVPLSTALNIINRSMGREDLYPFVIPAPVLDKLDFVASLMPE